jgi:hypothetical protein
VLDPREHAIALTLASDSRGHLRVSGATRHDLRLSTSLRFEFESDQTYLSAAIDELREALDLLPVLEG